MTGCKADYGQTWTHSVSSICFISWFYRPLKHFCMTIDQEWPKLDWSTAYLISTHVWCLSHPACELKDHKMTSFLGTGFGQSFSWFSNTKRGTCSYCGYYLDRIMFLKITWKEPHFLEIREWSHSLECN